MTVSFLIPVRSDRRLERSIERLLEFIENEKMSTEIIVCGELVKGQDIHKAIYIPIIPALKGKCIREGMKHCTGEAIVVCDADIPVCNNDIRNLIDTLKNCDVAFGHRFLPHSIIVNPPPFSRQIASRAFRFLVRKLFSLHGADTQCGIKAFRAPAAHSIFSKIDTDGLMYDVEVVLTVRRSRMCLCYVPMNWSYTKSTISIWKAAPLVLFDLFVLYIHQNRYSGNRQDSRVFLDKVNDITSRWSGRLRGLLERIPGLQ